MWDVGWSVWKTHLLFVVMTLCLFFKGPLPLAWKTHLLFVAMASCREFFTRSTSAQNVQSFRVIIIVTTSRRRPSSSAAGAKFGHVVYVQACGETAVTPKRKHTCIPRRPRIHAATHPRTHASAHPRHATTQVSQQQLSVRLHRKVKHEKQCSA